MRQILRTILAASLGSLALVACKTTSAPRTATPCPRQPSPATESSPVSHAPDSSSLNARLRALCDRFPGKLSVEIASVTPDGQAIPVFSYAANRRLPMASVYKFPIALALLNAADSGKFSTASRWTLSAADLPPGTWSPLRDAHPAGGTFRLDQLVEYTVARSDNPASDYLLRILGGTGAVQADLASWGLPAIRVRDSEAAMKRDHSLQHRNSASARDLSRLLAKFIRGSLVSPRSTRLLAGIMSQTSTGTSRVAAGVPSSRGWTWAHKTGTGFDLPGSFPAENIPVAACNDAGVLTLPDGRQFTIVCLTANASLARSEAFMAGLARAFAAALSCAPAH